MIEFCFLCGPWNLSGVIYNKSTEDESMWKMQLFFFSEVYLKSPVRVSSSLWGCPAISRLANWFSSLPNEEVSDVGILEFGTWVENIYIIVVEICAPLLSLYHWENLLMYNVPLKLNPKLWRKVGQSLGTHRSPVGPSWSAHHMQCIPVSSSGSVKGPFMIPCCVSCGCGNLLTTSAFGVGFYYTVLPFPGVLFSGHEDEKQDLRIVLVFTCLNDASELSQRMMSCLYIHKSLWFFLKKCTFLFKNCFYSFSFTWM